VSNLAARTEIIKLAALLGVDEHRLAALEGLDPATLREFRSQVTDLLFESDLGGLQGIAKASRLVPVAVSAKVAESAFPPQLSARLAGLLEPSRAVELARRLPVDYLAELAPYLDPRRITAIIGELPTDLIVAVTQRVAAREDWITLGRFVGHLGDEAITAAAAVLGDDALLRVGFVAEDLDRLGTVVHSLSEERLQRVVRVAHETGLWREALNLLDVLDEESRGILADVAANADPAVLVSMAETAQAEDLWDVALTAVRAMSPGSRATFALVAAELPAATRETLAERAEAHDLLDELGPIREALGV
jgi:hypothetical protein